MRLPKKFLPCLAAVLAVSAIAPIGTASAATTIGNRCVAHTTVDATVTQLAQVSDQLPVTAPQSGVITRWGTAVVPYAGGLTMQLKVLRPTGAANTFRVVAQTPFEVVVSGVNSYETRLPIEAGDKIGAFGKPATLFCTMTTDVGDVVGAVMGDQTVGATSLYNTGTRALVPFTATIEPDADGDGDETQDFCPTQAAFQQACPPLLLNAVALPAGKNSVRILVASSLEANIKVAASARVRAKKSKRGKKGASEVKLASVTQLVKPGQLARYVLNFTRPLRRQLNALPRSKSLKLKVVASGRNSVGERFSKRLTVKLKGRAGKKRK